MPAFFVEQRFWYWVKFDLHAWGNNKRNLLWNEMGCNHIERIEIVPWVKRGQGYCLVNGLLKKEISVIQKHNTHQSLRNDTWNCCTTPPSLAARGDVHWVFSTGHRQGGTAGQGAPGQSREAFLPFLLHSASANVNSDPAEGQNPSLGWGQNPSIAWGHSPHSSQGLWSRARLLLPWPGDSLSCCWDQHKPGREWFQLLEEQLLLQKTWMKPINPFSKSCLNWVKSWPAGSVYSSAGLSLGQEQLLTSAQTWAETDLHHILLLSPLPVRTLQWKSRMLPEILGVCSTLCLVNLLSHICSP